MKLLKISVILLFLMCFLHENAFGHPHYRHRKPHTIGAPLDGGFLIALGAAGAAYYSLRKKKIGNKES